MSCASKTACTAVGSYVNGRSGRGFTLAERWNGSGWSIQQTPSLGGEGYLKGVSCASTSVCTAVGAVGGGPGEASGPRMLVERYQ